MANNIRPKATLHARLKTRVGNPPQRISSHSNSPRPPSRTGSELSSSDLEVSRPPPLRRLHKPIHDETGEPPPQRIKRSKGSLGLMPTVPIPPLPSPKNNQDYYANNSESVIFSQSNPPPTEIQAKLEKYVIAKTSIGESRYLVHDSNQDETGQHMGIVEVREHGNNSFEISTTEDQNDDDVLMFAKVIMSIVEPEQPMVLDSGDPKDILQVLSYLQQARPNEVLLVISDDLANAVRELNQDPKLTKAPDINVVSESDFDGGKHEIAVNLGPKGP